MHQDVQVATSSEQWVILDLGLSYMDDDPAVVGPFPTREAAEEACEGIPHATEVIPLWDVSEWRAGILSEHSEDALDDDEM